MIGTHNLSVNFGGSVLFDKLSFRLQKGDRAGLIGRNGAGKSTLLKILSGQMTAYTGQLAIEKEVRIGFLSQEIGFAGGKTAIEEATMAFAEIKELEAEQKETELQLAARTDYETNAYQKLIERLNHITTRYELLGGYSYRAKTEKILKGLGFTPTDFNKLLSEFSGGWRMRVELAKLLLQDNDVMLLDEPTNHLDIDSIIWFEQFLRSYQGAVLLVSHDRMFLDRVTNRTIEISGGRIFDLPKPYSQFLTLRETQKEQEENAWKNQQKQIQQTEKLIERFRAKASKASMAQSLIKKLERIDRIELDDVSQQRMTIRFPEAPRPGKVVLEVENVSKNYGPNHVLKGINLNVARGNRIAFVGQNGQGKTTLAKILVQEIAYEGSVKQGHNVLLGYFAQNQAEELDSDKTLVDIMFETATDANRSKIRDMLGAFLFGGDEAEKKVKVLSGGERNRLALCKMMLSPFNVLVMDEPTNHLDMLSKSILKEALLKFEGTLILVSHDRDFLQGLTNITYEFKNKGLKEYLGDINSYLNERNLDNFRELEKTKKVAAANVRADSGKSQWERQKKIKSIKNRISKTEKQISQLERTIAEIDVALSHNYDELSTKPEFFDSYANKKKELNRLMKVWESLSMELEESESKQ